MGTVISRSKGLVGKSSLLLTVIILVLATLLSFSPKTSAFSDGIWTGVANRSVNDGGMQLVKLSNGDAFAIGMDNGQAQTLSAIYKRNTNKWITGPTLDDVLNTPNVAPLPHRKVLIVGGVNSSGTSSDQAYIFDEAAMTITPTAPMQMARAAAGIVILADSRVMVVGGVDIGNTSPYPGPGTTAEIYDPSSGAWTRTADLSPYSASSATGVVLLQDGEVMVDADGGQSQILIYNPTTDSWSATQSLDQGQYFLGYNGLFRLPDGRIITIGGAGLNGEWTTETEVWNPGTGSWSSGPALPYTGSNANGTLQTISVTQLSDGDVMAYGGTNGTFVYRTATNDWQRVANAPVDGQYWQGVDLDTGQLLIIQAGNPRYSYLYTENSGAAADTTPPVLGGISWTKNPLADDASSTLSVPVTDDNSGVVSGEYYLSTDFRAPGYGVAMNWDGTNLTATFTNMNPGAYQLFVRARDGAGNWSQPTATDLVVYNPDTGIVVSGSSVHFIPASSTSDPGDSLPFTTVNSNHQAHSSFSVRYRANGTLAGNDLAFSYAANSTDSMTITSQSYAWLVATSATNAQFAGTATVNIVIGGVSTSQTMTYLVSVQDGATTGTPDRLSIKLFNPGSDILSDTPQYQLSGQLQSGDLSIVGAPAGPS
jgi:kelch motif-containing protein